MTLDRDRVRGLSERLELFRDLLESCGYLFFILFISTLVLGLFVPLLPWPWINMALWGVLQIGLIAGLMRLSLRANPDPGDGTKVTFWKRIKGAAREALRLFGGVFATAIGGICLQQTLTKPNFDAFGLPLFASITLVGVWMVVSAIRQYLLYLRASA